MDGDTDLAAVGALFGEPARARMLAALFDGRALPASTLAAEASVAPSTASEHLRRLVDGDMLTVERHGRHRYYRIASPRVAHLLETVAEHAPPAPVRSLRDGTRAHALRRGRYCYDHLAGRLGVGIMGALLGSGALVGGDGRFQPVRDETDRLASAGHDVDYELTDPGAALLQGLGVDTAALARGRRPMIRYCVDWTEQRHHLAGALGAAIASRLLERDWVRRTRAPRAVTLTDAGRAGLDELGVDVAAVDA